MSPSSSRSVAAHHRAGVPLIAAVFVLSACSGTPVEPSASAPASIASIPRSSAAAVPTTTAPKPVEGPLIRADTSEDEITQLYRVFNTCLKRQGVPIASVDKGISQDAETQKKYRKEVTACASKRPESVADREERKDPSAFHDHLRQQVTCMKAEGQEVILIPPDGWGISDEAAARGYSPDSRVVKKCQVEAFGR